MRWEASGVRSVNRTSWQLAVLVAVGILTVMSEEVWSQEPLSPAVRAELAKRDAVIAALLRRINELEARVAAVDQNRPYPVPGYGRPPGVPGRGIADGPDGHHTADGPDGHQTANAAPGPGSAEATEADRALERTLVATGALLLPPRRVEIEPGFQYARRHGEFPAVLNADGVSTLVETEVQRNEFTGFLNLRAGLPWDLQIEVGLPFEYVDQSAVVRQGLAPRSTDNSSASSFGDLRIGLAKTFLREKAWFPDLIGRFEWDTGTGKQSEGDIAFGNGFDELTGSVTAVKRQDPLAFVGTVSYTAAFENDHIDPGNRWDFSIAALLAASPSTSLRIGLDQSFIDEVSVRGSKVNGSDQVASSLQIGASSLLWNGLLINLNAGIGLTQDAPDYTIGFSLPYQFNLPLGR